jgi:hypothetical protein
MERKLVDKTFTIVVDQQATSYNKKFVLDKNIALVRGVLVSSDQPKLLFFRGSQRIEVNGDELFPEDYESKILMAGLSVPPDEKFRSLGDGVVAGNGEIKVLYKDTMHNEAGFSAYKVNIIFQCELK